MGLSNVPVHSCHGNSIHLSWHLSCSDFTYAVTTFICKNEQKEEITLHAQQPNIRGANSLPNLLITPLITYWLSNQGSGTNMCLKFVFKSSQLYLCNTRTCYAISDLFPICIIHCISHCIIHCTMQEIIDFLHCTVYYTV